MTADDHTTTTPAMATRLRTAHNAATMVARLRTALAALDEWLEIDDTIIDALYIGGILEDGDVPEWDEGTLIADDWDDDDDWDWQDWSDDIDDDDQDDIDNVDEDDEDDDGAED